ncbi:MAG: PAS domain S-box protein [Sandaracinaceae bacterium]|nr:MAG: PAS domain S-box protein [Sandaracinaceae bacterium]
MQPPDIALTIAENATLGVVMMDAHQKCTYLNAAAEKMFGVTLAEVLRRDEPLHDIIHHTRPDGRHFPMAECPIDRALPERANMQGTDVFVRPDGHFYPVAYTASPILEGGKPVGTIIEVRDLSDERRAEAEREQIEARYRFLAEQLPAHVWTSDPAGKLDYVSDRTAAYFGVTVPQLLLDGWQGVIHPDDLAATVETWTHSLETGAPYEVEFRLRRADGVYRWHLARASAQRGPGGRLLKWFGTNTDIEDRRRVERERDEAYQAAELERNRLQNLLMQAPAAVAMYRGPEHLIAMCNPIWERFTGAEDALGRPFDEVFPQLVGSEARRALDRARESGEAIVGEEVPVALVIEGEPRETFWNFVVQPVLTPTGEVDALLAHAVDVSAQVAARREIERRAEELTRLSEELRHTNEELDKFAYVASHDLKAPLRGISTLATFIEQDSVEQLSEASRGHFELLRGRVERMQALIDGILAYSRATRERGARTTRRVSLADLAREAFDLLGAPEGVELEVGELPTLEAEPVLLQQVFLNLLSNAVKHGGAHVRVVSQPRDGVVEVGVIDDGPGIAPAHHERIWELFQTLDRREDDQSTGVGLPVVRKIVESRGGRVRVESDEGEGAAFYFTWPARAEP